MEAAMKMSRQYFLEKQPPEPQRVKFIARHESYHGTTLGGLSVGGHKGRRALFEPMLLPNISWVSACNAYRGKRDGESDESYVQRLAKELDEEFERQDPGTVCAFVAEPVVGAVGLGSYLVHFTPDPLTPAGIGLCPFRARLFRRNARCVP